MSKGDGNIRTRDARGRLVTQLDPVRLHVWHRCDAIEADVLSEIVEDLEPGTAKLRRHMILLIPCAIVVVGLGIATLYFTSDASGRKDLVSTLLNPAIMLPNILCCVFIPWMTARHARMKRVRFAMLKHRRCPHCGYNLYGLPTASEDEATVCPECGCAWLIDEAELTERLAATAALTGHTGAGRKTLVVVFLLLGVMAFGGMLAFMMAR